MGSAASGDRGYDRDFSLVRQNGEGLISVALGAPLPSLAPFFGVLFGTPITQCHIRCYKLLEPRGRTGL
jgi:hypothetical protein